MQIKAYLDMEIEITEETEDEFYSATQNLKAWLELAKDFDIKFNDVEIK